MVELDPRSARGYVEAALTASVLGRYQQAEQWLLKSIAIAPEEPRSYVGLASLAITPAWLRADPLWDHLRSNPRFQKLLAGQGN